MPSVAPTDDRTVAGGLAALFAHPLLTMDSVGEIRLETIKRHAEEPKLEIGDTVCLYDGVKGVVLARYLPSHHRVEVR